METNKFFLDETGCYTTDIRKAKALICSKGIFVKPKCFVDENLNVVTDLSKAWAIVNAYDKDRLQVMLLRSGGPVTHKRFVLEMSRYVVKQYPKNYRLEPIYPTSKICMLANFMEPQALVTDCFTATQIVDRYGKIKNPRIGSIDEIPPSISGVRRSRTTQVTAHGKTYPFKGKKEQIIEDLCCKSKSYPAFLISFDVFNKINPDVDFLKNYLYFVE